MMIVVHTQTKRGTMHKNILSGRQKPLDKQPNLCYIVPMKKNNLQKWNDEANKMFADEVLMPMTKFAVTIIFVAVILDYGFQMIDAIDILTR
jgi:hypothetical protein